MSRSFLLDPPEVLVGLGPDRAGQLAAAGITRIALLFERGPRAAHRAMPGTTAAQVGQWFCAAMLLRTVGVTPALAAALVAGGIRSVAALGEAELQGLEQLAAAARGAGALAEPPPVYELSAMQRSAARAALTGMLAGRVLGRPPAGSAAAPAPIADATVSIAGESTETGEDGWFALNRVPPGRARLSVELPDRRERFRGRPIDISAGKFGRLALITVPSEARPLVGRAERESEGFLVINHPGFVHRLVERPLADFPVGTCFLVREIPATGRARLLSFDKVRHGTTIFIERARAPVSALPDPTAAGAVVRWNGQALEATALTRADVHRERLERWAAGHPIARRRRIPFR
jgi:hypothetical protein